MRRVRGSVVAGLVGAGLAVFALPARADDIYRWTDSGGQVHYSNTPTADAPSARVADIPPLPTAAAVVPQETGEEGEVPAHAASAAADAFSTEASLRRNALERDLRATEGRIRALDARLATLGRARNQNAGGSAATGGVGALALDVRSEEERGLATEREQLVQHAAEVRAEAGRLRDELTARLGTTPAWWNDIR